MLDQEIFDINTRIETEFCLDTSLELTDEKLLSQYKECNSVKRKIEAMEKILEPYVSNEIKVKIIQDYILELIPAGTKGVIRGIRFNTIIKNFISNLGLNNDRFEICFEKKLSLTSEIPDWYILEKSTNKILIGMNQLDLWKGGAQANRGSYYLENNKCNTETSKLVCVICNKIQFKNKTKIYKLFETGFRNNTLCYLNNLKNIIDLYFN